jgi:hypothetical protein
MKLFAVVTGLTSLTTLAFMIELLRRRQLREKYAMLWLAVCVVVVPVAFVPSAVDKVAVAFGFASGVSLLLLLSVVFLLLICMHLSWEVSRLEEETRTLAEDIALLRTEMLARSAAREPADDQR